ncbi:MAG: hypothetical protein ABW277_08880 [Longimicrobiaceae bacterium]
MLGITLWQLVRDVVLWAQVPPGERPGLFRPLAAAQTARLAQAADEAPELAEPLRELAMMVATPGRAEAARVAEACERVLVWAELRGMRETALQFAEAAARVENETPLRNHAAGRLCRRAHDYQRAGLWYRRGYRLARLRGLEAECAIALIGLGGVAMDQGHLNEAEAHFRRASRAALRQGRNRLAGAAYHELFVVAVHAGHHEDAISYADRTISLYPAKHHRIPNLAYDVAFFWMQLGYFSSAIYLCEKLLPWFEGQSLRILVLAALARSSGAVHDRVRYERTSAEVLRMVAAGNEWAAASLYHLAEGVRYFEYWERAETLARRSLEEAKRVGNQSVIAASENLLITLLLRTQGPDDIVPEEGSLVDRTTGAVLRKLMRQPAPGSSEAVLFPERHQMD